MHRKQRTEAQRKAHRQEIESAGGWYLYNRQQREEREQQARKPRHERITTYREREIITKE